MTVELSVVLPVHNGGDLLARQLGALVGQSMTAGLEIVVVNNRSTDDSLTIANGFAAASPNISVLDAPHCRSRSDAVNHGVLHCSSELIATVDHDDVVCPTWAESMSAALRTADLVGGAVALVAEPIPVDCEARLHFSTELPVHGQYLPFAFGCSMGFTRELFELLGGFDPAIRHAEDVDFCWRAQEAGRHLTFARDARLIKSRRGSLRERFHQHKAYGKSDVALARRFSNYGVSRLLSRTVKQLVWLIVTLPLASVVASRRSDWAAVAGRTIGVAIGLAPSRRDKDQPPPSGGRG